MEFGTGVVKITPAHDPNDFEVGNRHNLERILVMHEDGTMNQKAGKYEGMDRFECRKQIVKDLQEAGVLFKIEDHMHSVGHSERSGAVVEPYLSTQWFVKMQPLQMQQFSFNNKRMTKKFISHQIVLKKHTYVGWKIFVIGVFLVNYGGDIVSQLGIIKKQAKCMLVQKTSRYRKLESR